MLPLVSIPNLSLKDSYCIATTQLTYEGTGNVFNCLQDFTLFGRSPVAVQFNPIVC